MAIPPNQGTKTHTSSHVTGTGLHVVSQENDHKVLAERTVPPCGHRMHCWATNHAAFNRDLLHCNLTLGQTVYQSTLRSQSPY